MPKKVRGSIRSIGDDELDEYRLSVGIEIYEKEYNIIYSRTVYRTSHNIRHSGQEYKNNDDKIKNIKEKYKKGVTDDILNEWLF